MTLHTSFLSKLRYRPDIDGLRAFAVLSVVAFHAFPSIVTGGFIGVDIFFVISGFLISIILFEKLDHGSFSFWEFYSRRIKRIFPTLFIVLVACFIAGWFTLLTYEYSQLGKHIAAGAGFISNFILWGEAGYFDNDADTKPLLHLWSLGIEEQFYIIWPFVLWCAWRSKFNAFTITILVASLSFALNFKEARYDVVADFFSPQTRFWELLSGSLLAWFTLYQKDRLKTIFQTIESFLDSLFKQEKLISNKKILPNFLSFFGALLLSYGIWKINKELRFPGQWALLPVAGTVFIMMAGTDAWFNRVILSNKLAVWFGLISYPLYLWHWPLLSFAKIMEGQIPSEDIRLGAVGLSILFAWLTYRFIEQPIRNSKSPYWAAVLVGLIIAIGFAGYDAFKRDGLAFRSIIKHSTGLSGYNNFKNFDREIVESDIWQIEREYFTTNKKRCFFHMPDVESLIENQCGVFSDSSRPKVLLIGDSHAAYLGRYLQATLKDRYQFEEIEVASAGCPFLAIGDELKPGCLKFDQYLKGIIHLAKPETLIVFGNYVSSPGLTPDLLKQRLLEYKTEGASNIILVGQMPLWKGVLPDYLLRQYVHRRLAVPQRNSEFVNLKSISFDEDLSQKLNGPEFNYASLNKLLCKNGACLIRVGDNLSTDLVVWDYGHLTDSGAEYVYKNLLEKYFHKK
jgi:peptidoglycan/LPS O-acetylase OafA/YrhL